LHKFPKSERLHSKVEIEELFSRGQQFSLYPLKIIYLLKEQEGPLFSNQVLFAVPKKRFKRAVDRNLLKRRIREAYRLNKDLLTRKGPEFYLLIGYIYIGREIEKYQVIEKKLKLSLLRLKKEIGS
jgi:ribonuclease P protein component